MYPNMNMPIRAPMMSPSMSMIDTHRKTLLRPFFAGTGGSSFLCATDACAPVRWKAGIGVGAMALSVTALVFSCRGAVFSESSGEGLVGSETRGPAVCEEVSLVSNDMNG